VLARLASAALLGAAIASAPRAGIAGEDGAAPPIIVLVIAARDDAADATDAGERAAQAIAAHVRRLGVELAVVHDRAPGPPQIAVRSRALATERHARGVLWVGVGRGELSLFLFEREGERMFERRVPAEKGQTSAAVESLALIARSASAELLEGNVAAMTPVTSRDAVPADPAPPPAPEPAASPALVAEPARLAPAPTEGPDRTSFTAGAGGASLGVGYVGSTMGRSVPWQSALAAEAGWRLASHAVVALGYEIVLPESTATGFGAPQTYHHPIFAAGGYRVLLAPRWDVGLGGRSTVDVVTHEGGRMFGPDAGTQARGTLGPTASAAVRIMPAMSAGLLVGMDVVLNPESAPGGVSASDRLRFVGGLGLQIDLDMSTRPPAPRIIASR
jgi:hypothetical protein